MNSTPKAIGPDDALVGRADERLAHAYEQITRADEQLARLTEQLEKMERDAARPPSARPLQSRIQRFRHFKKVFSIGNAEVRLL